MSRIHFSPYLPALSLLDVLILHDLLKVIFLQQTYGSRRLGQHGGTVLRTVT